MARDFVTMATLVLFAAGTAVSADKPAEPDEITVSAGVQFVRVPAGEFRMGLAPAQIEDGEKSSLQMVKVGRPFYLGRCEVTQGEFRAVVGRSPWKDRPDVEEEALNAASYVSWYDAVEFCNALSVREKLPARYAISEAKRENDGSIESANVIDSGGTGYRLPTDAEWEYACRAGSTSKWHSGDDARSLKEYAWYGEDRGNKHPARGALKKPNPFGLFDMHGNVYEWCWNSHPTDASGASGSGANRVVRGGSWRSDSKHLRSGYRSGNAPTLRYDTLGFRVARDAAK
jgi:formylglycine-generating enzyme required for sulfatase activity